MYSSFMQRARIKCAEFVQTTELEELHQSIGLLDTLFQLPHPSSPILRNQFLINSKAQRPLWMGKSQLQSSLSIGLSYAIPAASSFAISTPSPSSSPSAPSFAGKAGRIQCNFTIGCPDASCPELRVIETTIYSFSDCHSAASSARKSLAAMKQRQHMNESGEFLLFSCKMAVDTSDNLVLMVEEKNIQLLALEDIVKWIGLSSASDADIIDFVRSLWIGFETFASLASDDAYTPVLRTALLLCINRINFDFSSWIFDARERIRLLSIPQNPLEETFDSLMKSPQTIRSDNANRIGHVIGRLKSRFIILSDHFLYYFGQRLDEGETSKPVKFLDLSLPGLSCIFKRGSKEYMRWKFLILSPRRKYKFCMPTRLQAEEWASDIQAVIDRFKTSPKSKVDDLEAGTIAMTRSLQFVPDWALQSPSSSPSSSSSSPSSSAPLSRGFLAPLLHPTACSAFENILSFLPTRDLQLLASLDIIPASPCPSLWDTRLFDRFGFGWSTYVDIFGAGAASSAQSLYFLLEKQIRAELQTVFSILVQNDSFSKNAVEKAIIGLKAVSKKYALIEEMEIQCEDEEDEEQLLEAVKCLIFGLSMVYNPTIAMQSKDIVQSIVTLFAAENKEQPIRLLANKTVVRLINGQQQKEWKIVNREVQGDLSSLMTALGLRIEADSVHARAFEMLIARIHV